MIPFQAAPSTTSIVYLILVGLYLAFLLIALWVMQDARLRGMKGPFWFALVFLVPILGLIVYVIFRREPPV